MALFNAKIRVMVKPAINDPESQTIEKALLMLGFNSISRVRTGKYFQVTLEAKTHSAAETLATEMCENLLANPVIEHFDLEIENIE